jgi:hypothetical protein
MRRCNKCKRNVTNGYLFIPRGTRCQDCFEKEMEGIEWKCASEIDGDEEITQKGLYDNEDYVFVKGNGHWIMTNKFFALFDEE